MKAPKYDPTETITWSDDSVTLSQDAVIALLEFASINELRPHLCSVGVSDGCLAATDGHSLLRYDNPQREPVAALQLHSKVWSREHVQMALAVAKLGKRDVVLQYADMLDKVMFPPVAQVIPEPGFGELKTRKVRGKDETATEVKMTPVGVNPIYLARMVKVCKALRTQGCLITAMRGELAPLMFRVDGSKGCCINATIVIMPMRY